MELILSVLTHITWPVAFLIVFIVLFRPIWSLLKCLTEAFGSVDKFELGSLKLSKKTQLELGETNISDTRYIEMLKAFDSPTIKNEEKAIRKHLTEAKFTSKEAINILISQLANRTLLTQLFFIDRMILNEQVQLLIFLNYNHGYRPSFELNQFYLEYKKFYKQNNLSQEKITEMTEDQFLTFLLINGLIEQNKMGFSISQLGQDYLGFALRIGRNLFNTD